MSVIIKAEGLGKKYILSHQQKQSYYALREVMADTIKRVGNKLIHPLSSRRGPDPRREEFWALQDVSFEIEQGDRVGIIGRNGAGKSTLLKILSRIVEPTKGRVGINGRVASLLEVGTGFHPELTGRENIYLNGAIIGMTRAEIKRKFDEIVDFAEVEKFLDTPVKRYSSGMYVRLAFAVSAHLEPEILMVDEVLAVGDAQFQKKCLGKMRDVSNQEGRTVLFVSHNLQSIRQICNRTICITNGKIAADGPTDEVVNYYLQSSERGESISDIKKMISKLRPDPAIKLHDIAVKQDGQIDNHIVTGKPVEIVMDYQVLQETYGLRVYFVLSDMEGTALFRSFAHADQDELPRMTPGKYISTAVIPADFLAPIIYRLEVSASIYNTRVCFPECIPIDLHVSEAGRLKHVYALDGKIGFKLAPLIHWNTESK